MSTPTSFVPKENTATVPSHKREELPTPLPETKDEWDNCKYINLLLPRVIFLNVLHLLYYYV